MPNYGPKDLNFYPAYCFHLSPTYNSWVRLTATDVLALKEREGFEGQNLYFHLNHPIRWIRLVGVIVAFDILPSRFIFTLDDSSGETIDAICERSKVALPPESNNEMCQPVGLPQSPRKGLTAKGGEVDLADIDVGTVVKIKGGIGAWKGRRQVSLERIAIIRTTNEECAAWAENAAFLKDTLDKPWIVQDKEERRAKRKAKGRDKERELRITKMEMGKRQQGVRNGDPREDNGIVEEEKRLQTERRRVGERERERLEREKEMEKRLHERLEGEKEVARRNLKAKAAMEQDEKRRENECRKMELQKQREWDEQQRQEAEAEREREQLRKRRNADRAERERIFAEQMGFGQPATSGAGFGSGTANTSGGFGGFGSGGTSGFGSSTNNNPAFGQSKPAFGASSSGGGLFGGGTSTAGGAGGFGGFGANNNNNASAGGLFGSAPKPSFGSGSTLFGSANAGGFGSSNNQATSAFGAPVSSALAQNNAVCEGTGSTPFTAFTEKETASNVVNHFQSISFMAPYKNFSFEELRLADYNQGRRFGNGSGQAGAFGSTNFGGFGQQNSASSGFGQPVNTAGGGLFGSTTTTSSPFGGNQSGGFGAASTGSTLFGQKPGGLFGAASSSQPPGGLFGSANNTSGGFGSVNPSGGFGSGGGLFGQNNNQQSQSKPPSFGSATATAGGGGFGSAGTGFGSTSTNTGTGGGLFGQPNQANNTAFGQQNTAQTSNPFGGFGQQNQNQNQNQGGTNNPFGGFGQPNQEQKPGGLFGNASTSTNAGVGLFGSQNNNPPGGGLFGQANNNQSSASSLFGQKPATGGSLFGQTATANSNTGGSLFGGFGNNNNANQNQNQQNQGVGLFGNNNNNQQKPGGLFGNPNSNTGGSLFGNSTANNQQPSGSLFNLGGLNNQQQLQPAGGSLFGNVANNNTGSSLFGSLQQQQPTPQNQFQPTGTLQTSIIDPNAFGSPSIFSGLPPPPQVSGPIATPISQKTKQKKSALLPYYKLTPNGASRLQTPQKRGFGFSYSSYGTPGSASSIASTPGGLGSSLLQSGFGRSLGKSLSTSNLRSNFGDADSILVPGAFSAGSSRFGSAGSMKKLTIDRSLRTDLFGDKGMAATLPSPEKERQPGILKKKVSFDASTVGGNGKQQDGIQANGTHGDNANSSTAPSAGEQGFLRSSNHKTTAKPNGVTAHPEMEQVRGNELAIVPEDESPAPATAPQKRAGAPTSQEDQQAGDYWMTPSKNEIQKMTKEQRRHVSGFQVGRVGCGKVEFNEPVDLTNINLEDIYGNLVVIELRSLTVYPDQSKKPALGKGLNVPSTIYLENSWPRARDRKSPSYETSGPRFNKHVDRLRKVKGTEFVDYDKDTGIWSFKVPHFTTYGFDYDEDASESEILRMSTMTDPPDTPTPMSRATSNGQTSKPLVSKRRSLNLPGVGSHKTSEDETFSGRPLKRPPPGAFDEAAMFLEDDDHKMEEQNGNKLSFLDQQLDSASDSGENEPSELPVTSVEIEDRSLVVRNADKDVEMEMAGAFPEHDEEVMSKHVSGDGMIGILNVSGDWAQELQRTIDARKQDRQALRKAQARVLDEQEIINSDLGTGSDTKESRLAIATHTDLMNSLFGQPAPKRGMNIGNAAKVLSLKSSSSTLKYPANAKDMKLEIDRQWYDLVSKTRKTHTANPAEISNLTPDTLMRQRARTSFVLNEGIPMAVPPQTPFNDYALAMQSNEGYEKAIWTLASILFDDQGCEAYGVPAAQKDKYEARIRKDRLIAFWQGLCSEEAKRAAENAPNAEERAIAQLSACKITHACEALVQGRDYRLATLVSQIGGDQVMHQQISAQIEAWKTLNVLSEMSEPIRAIYSLLAGKACICEGTLAKHIEDKVKAFAISERFNLDWKRAFGLRLYYAISIDEPIEAAITKYEGELHEDEPRKPEQDMLYTLLQLYAASKGVLPTPSLEHIFVPDTAAPTAPTARLSFQLYVALALRFPSTLNPQASDRLAITFATQLDAAGEWLWAMFALTHLTDPGLRQQYIRALLSRHAKDITADPPMEGNWSMLTKELKLPPAWIWEAKALYARAVDGDRVREANYLVKAGQWVQAHDVLKRIVGPDCVIAEEWGQLQGLLDSFKPGKEELDGWGLGGQVYADYLGLVAKDLEGQEKAALLGRLLESLPTMMHDLDEEGNKHQTDEDEEKAKARFRERVALQEMSGLVGKEVLAITGEVCCPNPDYCPIGFLMRTRKQGIEAAKVFQLPSSDDVYLKHTMELSLRYYQAVMASGG
ncbi:MAG: hypothetical protein Q9163_001391 [Psora crenata]